MQTSLSWVAALLRNTASRARPHDARPDLEPLDGEPEQGEEPPTTARRRAEARERRRSFEDPSLPVERCVVDNRVFLLGFDELYRRNMRWHERRELLPCARAVADALDVQPADEPVEGYYADDEALAEYFRFLRAFEGVPRERRRSVAGMKEFQRLEQVRTSALFRRTSDDTLLPGNADCMCGALWTTPEWNVPNLLERAYLNAFHSDDVSLTAMAALSRDPIVMASLRESLVLYAPPVVHGQPRYATRELVWAVDDEITRRATRFVQTFNALFNDDLPLPSAADADLFWDACDTETVIGRCVALAEMPGRGYYHWAVRREGGQLVVDDFWSGEAWSTDTYCAERSPWS